MESRHASLSGCSFPSPRNNDTYRWMVVVGIRRPQLVAHDDKLPGKELSGVCFWLDLDRNFLPLFPRSLESFVCE